MGVAGNLRCNDFNALTSVDWFYNWGITPSKTSNCTRAQLRNVEFYPMFWSWYGGDLSTVQLPLNTTTILGYNEPNIVGQAELTPASAVQGWLALQSAFPNKILVSPSASSCVGDQCFEGWSQLEWFDEFFRLCNDSVPPCKIDYMAVHFYWCSNNVNGWIGALWNIYNRYGYKLWLTEFNCYGRSSGEQKIFMQSVIPALEKEDFIEKYAWFVVRNANCFYTNDLLTFDVSKSKLTDLGQVIPQLQIHQVINLHHHQFNFKFEIISKLLCINKLKWRFRMICLMDIIYGDWNFKSWILC
eukprot:434625_1